MAVPLGTHAQSVAATCTYHGISTMGNIKLIHDGIKVLAYGTLHEIVDQPHSQRHPTSKDVLVHRTPDVLKPNQREISIVCIGTDGKKYRFSGVLEDKKKRGPACAAIDDTSSTVPAISAGSVSSGSHVSIPSPSPDSGKDPAAIHAPQFADTANTSPAVSSARGGIRTGKPPSKRRSTAKKGVSSDDIAMVIAMRAAKQEHPVPLRMVLHLVQLARASVYRKIEQGIFPASKKRGRSSIWSLVELDLYLAGKWPPASSQEGETN
jgi:predicted DNA-binding transcriptional regulator AlpA